MKIEQWEINKLKNWEKNPRGISNKAFERLKKQLQELKEYKPLLITPDGTVIGGNMRLRAMRELDFEKVWVSIVEPKDEKELFKYAISDNDAAGYTEQDKLAEIVQELELQDLEDYAVQSGRSLTLKDVYEHFAPVEGTERLDELSEKEEKPVRCPQCGHEFTP